MKYITILFVILYSGCSSAKLMNQPCDAVSNRDDVFVCGRNDVMKKCRSVVDRKEMVCDKL